jgi:hypothetical protein
LQELRPLHQTDVLQVIRARLWQTGNLELVSRRGRQLNGCFETGAGQFSNGEDAGQIDGLIVPFAAEFGLYGRR